MRYLLDTNICSHIMQRHPPAIRQRLRSVPPAEVAISSISLAELRYGVAKSESRRNEQALTEFLAFVQVLDWPMEATHDYGAIRAELERYGQVIGGNDLLIAAHARHLGVTLVTRNEREFARVPQLIVETWGAPS